MDCTPLKATIPTLQSAVKRFISDLPVLKIAKPSRRPKELSYRHGTPSSSSSSSFSFPSPRNTYKRCQYYSHAVTSLGRTAYRRGSRQLGESLQGAVPCVGPSSCIRYHCLQWKPRPGIVSYIYRSGYVNYGFDGSNIKKGLIIIEHRSLGLGRASAVALFSTLGMYRRQDTYSIHKK